MVKIYKSVVILMALILVLTACGGIAQQAQQENSEPATNGEVTLAGDIPVYPNAKNYETGSNMIVDAMVNPMMEQFESQYGGNAQVKFFAVPQGTSAKDIESFYNEKMTGMGWKAEALENQASGSTTLVWTKADNNVFVLSFMEIPQMEPMLVTIVAQQS